MIPGDNAPALHEAYVCPGCRAPLEVGVGSLSCPLCNRRYPFDDGIADFLRGSYYDDFDARRPPSAESQVGLDHEAAGAGSRIGGFYLPRILARRRAARSEPLRLLDCGCGNGLSVDLLNEAGVSAWGNDPSALRKWQWRERRCKNRLFVADGGSLPVADGFFDVVLASGVLEHVGVRESRSDRYEVHPLPTRDADRCRFLAELLRVTAPDGAIWLDFPNGAFPIDFWHGDRPGAARRHGRHEGFLPTAAEIRLLVRELSADATVRFHSPHRRLQFGQIRTQWYGRLLAPVARGYLRLMCSPPLRSLAASAANPFLVVEISRREPDGPSP